MINSKNLRGYISEHIDNIHCIIGDLRQNLGRQDKLELECIMIYTGLIQEALGEYFEQPENKEENKND